MRLLVDESTGSAVVDSLRAAGHDVSAVAELTPRAEDSDVLALAVADQRVLITSDKDFGELVFRTSRPHAGVLLLRLRDNRPAERARVVQAALPQLGERLMGSFVVATERELRIRHFHA